LKNQEHNNQSIINRFKQAGKKAYISEKKINVKYKIAFFFNFFNVTFVE